MKLSFTFLIILLLLNSGCKKQTITPENREAFLATGTWHITAYQLRTILGTTDIYATNPACRNDDYYVFSINGTLEHNEGNTKCNASDPQSQASQWHFYSATSVKLIMNSNEYSYHKLDDNRFEIITWFIDPYAPEHDIIYTRQ